MSDECKNIEAMCCTFEARRSVGGDRVLGLVRLALFSAELRLNQRGIDSLPSEVSLYYAQHVTARRDECGERQLQ